MLKVDRFEDAAGGVWVGAGERGRFGDVGAVAESCAVSGVVLIL